MRSSYVIAAVAAIIVVIVVVAIVLIMGQPGGDLNGPDAVEGSSIDIRNLEFSPTPITVTVGTTVVWTNNDTVDHTVTSTSGPASFDSGVMEGGDTFGFTFAEAGTYDYFCELHPFMRAQVIVISES